MTLDDQGWAASAKFQPTVRAELSKFFERDDTFSLGICNGCQLMALLGVVPFSQFVSAMLQSF